VTGRNRWQGVRRCLGVAACTVVLGGCVLTRAHVSNRDLINGGEQVAVLGTANLEDTTDKSPGYRYARSLREAFRLKRQAIEDAQASSLSMLIPLAGYVGYKAARGGTTANLGALSTGGLTGLALSQALVQLGRVRVYTAAESSLSCGISVYEVARGDASPADALDAELIRFERLLQQQHLQLGRIERNRADIFQPYGEGRNDLLAVIAKPTATDATDAAAELHVLAAADTSVLLAQSAQAGALREILRRSRAAISTDAQLGAFARLIQAKASQELDNTVADPSLSLGLLTSLQENRLPPKMTPPGPNPGRAGPAALAPGKPALAARRFADREFPAIDANAIALEGLRARVEEVTRGLGTTRTTLAFDACAYTPASPTYTAPTQSFELGRGDSDANSNKELTIGESLVVVAYNGSAPHEAVPSGVHAGSLQVAKAAQPRITVFTISTTAQAKAGEVIDVVVMDHAGAHRSFKVTLK